MKKMNQKELNEWVTQAQRETELRFITSWFDAYRANKPLPAMLPWWRY